MNLVVRLRQMCQDLSDYKLSKYSTSVQRVMRQLIQNHHLLRGLVQQVEQLEIELNH